MVPAKWGFDACIPRDTDDSLGSFQSLAHGAIPEHRFVTGDGPANSPSA